MVSYAKEKKVSVMKHFPNEEISSKFTEIKKENSNFQMILKDTA